MTAQELFPTIEGRKHLKKGVDNTLYKPVSLRGQDIILKKVVKLPHGWITVDNMMSCGI